MASTGSVSGHAVAQLIGALRYKPDGYGFDLAASVVYGFACWPLEPKIAGSLPTEAVGFFIMEKSTARSTIGQMDN
jgi:hypothetical protein